MGTKHQSRCLDDITFFKALTRLLMEKEKRRRDTIRGRGKLISHAFVVPSSIFIFNLLFVFRGGGAGGIAPTVRTGPLPSLSARSPARPLARPEE